MTEMKPIGIMLLTYIRPNTAKESAKKWISADRSITTGSQHQTNFCLLPSSLRVCFESASSWLRLFMLLYRRSLEAQSKRTKEKVEVGQKKVRRTVEKSSFYPIIRVQIPKLLGINSQNIGLQIPKNNEKCY